MKQEPSKDVVFKTNAEMEVLSSQHKQQTDDDQQQQLSQIVNVSYQGDQVATSNTYEHVVNEDYSQEAGDYEGEQNETEYYEEFETSVVQPEEQVQVEIVGVEVNSIIPLGFCQNCVRDFEISSDFLISNLFSVV